VEVVRSTCLYVATVLGDLMDDLVVVGGLVPTLLIDPQPSDVHREAHVGTMDLDVGLALALLDAGRYRTLSERLRESGFEPDRNPDNRVTRQRWVVTGHGAVTLDFLIPPSSDSDVGGTLRDIERDFAAIITPGLALAFQDRKRIRLGGRTVRGENAAREVWVCGAGAFVVLKALAFRGRGENKDAYDLYYVVRNYGAGIEDVAARLRLLTGDAHAERALAVLREDFLDPDGVGPRRVAEFLVRGPGPDLQPDVVGFAQEAGAARPLEASSSVANFT
jgi:hypothetical protein